MSTGQTAAQGEHPGDKANQSRNHDCRSKVNAVLCTLCSVLKKEQQVDCGQLAPAPQENRGRAELVCTVCTLVKFRRRQNCEESHASPHNQQRTPCGVQLAGFTDFTYSTFLTLYCRDIFALTEML